jgi:hypothetical protein
MNMILTHGSLASQLFPFALGHILQQKSRQFYMEVRPHPVSHHAPQSGRGDVVRIHADEQAEQGGDGDLV